MPREQDVVKATVLPVTAAQITGELLKLGVEPGSVILLHASMSSLSWVVGREQAVLEAVLSAINPGGTLVCPSFTPWNSDPAHWKDPVISQGWYPLVRQNMPGYDPKISPTQGCGWVADCLRSHPAALRSDHPTSSFVAVGPQAEAILKNHTVQSPAFGPKSPIGRLYDMPNSKVLVIGPLWDRVSVGRYAEQQAGTAEKLVQGSSVKVGDDKDWVEWIDMKPTDKDKLKNLGEMFEREMSSKIVKGKVGKAEAKLFSVKDYADFCISKFKEKAHI